MKTNRKRILYLGVVLLTLLTSLFCCNSCNTIEKKDAQDDVNAIGSTQNKMKPINVMVLLDLSNRIDTSKHPGQADRDLIVINSILEVFDERQKHFGYVISKDKLAVIIANQSNPAYNESKFIDGMNIDMEDKMTHPKFNKTKTELIQKCSQLYEYAITDANSSADIYTWFKDYLPSIIKKGDYKNKVVIITDGYLAFDPIEISRRGKGTQIDWSDFNQLRNHPNNWEELYKKRNMGFKPHKDIDFGDTEVLLIEVAPRETHIYTHEMDLLHHFWTDWFQKMNIESEIYPLFKSKSELSGNIKRIIPNK